MTARPGGDGNTARRFPHRSPHRRPPSTVSQTPAASAEAPDRAVTDSPPLERASQTLPCSSRAAHLPDLISFDPVAFSSPPAREDPTRAFPARAKQSSEKTAANTDKPASSSEVGRFNATPRLPPSWPAPSLGTCARMRLSAHHKRKDTMHNASSPKTNKTWDSSERMQVTT